MFYFIEPEVAGGLGDGTVIDTTITPPYVSFLEYEFSGWLGDELLESFPCFVITQRLARALTQHQLTGFTLDVAAVKKTEEFKIMHPLIVLPDFLWLKVHGVVGSSDFGTAQDRRLVVSETALVVLRGYGLNYADVELYP